jgi:hypothetical protein
MSKNPYSAVALSFLVKDKAKKPLIETCIKSIEPNEVGMLWHYQDEDMIDLIEDLAHYQFEANIINPLKFNEKKTPSKKEQNEWGLSIIDKVIAGDLKGMKEIISKRKITNLTSIHGKSNLVNVPR